MSEAPNSWAIVQNEVPNSWEVSSAELLLMAQSLEKMFYYLLHIIN